MVIPFGGGRDNDKIKCSDHILDIKFLQWKIFLFLPLFETVSKSRVTEQQSNSYYAIVSVNTVYEK
jgi:hypothetical protein